MTEAEWLTCANPQQMLEFLSGKVSDRKLRLFACACCRRLWDFLTKACGKAVQAAEDYSEGLLGWEKLEQLGRRARQESGFGQRWSGLQDKLKAIASGAACYTTLGAGIAAAGAACHAAGALTVLGLEAVGATDEVMIIGMWEERLRVRWLHRAHGKAAKARERVREARVTEAREDAWWSARQEQAELLRCIVGNPFRLDTLPLSWRTQETVALAQDIFDRRQFEELPILADALEEVGCTDPEILSHLRGPGPHVRGCWVLDLLLGKE
jgi:hypothetical protein